jgi:diguanylate cyclase (GGDEF)-like protein
MPTSMSNIPLPESEATRLAALHSYAILDTLPEQAYDDISVLAAQICTTPIALVSLIDADRQWLKSRLGFDQVEMPRYQSFCTHAVLSPSELMVVEDASTDLRFNDNALVIGPPFIRFYAGAPLVTSEGHALGVLCVIDRVPRFLEGTQLEALRALSRQVVAQLELRRSNLQLQRHKELTEESRREFEQYEARLRDVNVQLHSQSFTDGLTGVHNRRAFDLHLAKAVADAASRGEVLSLVMLDVDHFKSFNDDFGHSSGDEVLRGVAQSIKSSARKQDIVARYGGEEFAVILPQTDAEQAYAMAKRLCAAVRETAWHNRAVTVSAGVATRGNGIADAETLVVAADRGLYEAKAGGRDRVCTMQSSQASETLDDVQRQASLARAS